VIRDVVHMGQTLRSCANMHHEEQLKPIRDNIPVLLGAKARIKKSANMVCTHKYLRTTIFFTIKITAFWDMKLGNLVDVYRRFEGTCSLHPHQHVAPKYR
jgi:hypothetical protein